MTVDLLHACISMFAIGSCLEAGLSTEDPADHMLRTLPALDGVRECWDDSFKPTPWRTTTEGMRGLIRRRASF